MDKLKITENGFANLLVLAGMLIVAVSLPIATKLVQQNQENRSNAAEKCSCSDAAYGDAYSCSKAGKKWTCKTVAVACTSVSYSSWSECVNGTQTRTIRSKYPKNCSGTAALERSCTVGSASDNAINNAAVTTENGVGYVCNSSNCANCTTESDCPVGCYWEKLTKQCISGTPTDDSTFFYYDPDSKNCIVTVSYSTLDFCNKYKRGACFKTASECNTANNNCTSKGGSCISSYDHCSGVFQSNLCPGDSTIKCCVAECNEDSIKCENNQIYNCRGGKWILNYTCNNGCNDSNTDCAPDPVTIKNGTCGQTLNGCINSNYNGNTTVDEVNVNWSCIDGNGVVFPCHIAKSIIATHLGQKTEEVDWSQYSSSKDDSTNANSAPTPTQYLIHESDPYYDSSNQNWLSVEDDVDMSQSSTANSNVITGKNTDLNNDSITNTIDFSNWKNYYLDNDLRGDLDNDGAITSLDGNIIKINM